ncbi:integrase [bacterium]|nr:MAG: integrase [bacterium]
MMKRGASTKRGSSAGSTALVPRQRPTKAEVVASCARLDRIVERYRRASKASNTRRMYDVGLKRWEAYCTDRHRREIVYPARPEAIARYLSWLAEYERLAVSTIEVYLAALHAIYVHTGTSRKEDPTRSFIVIETMRGIRREKGAPPHKKVPLTWDRLRSALPSADACGLRPLRDRALLLLGFALGARRSELAALRVTDVTFERQGMKVLIRRSKTDQTSKGRTVGIARLQDEALCPVRALRRWLDAAGIERGPIFRGLWPDGGLRERALTPEHIARMIKRCAEAAGLEGDFAGHSLRRGFATSAYAAGVPEIAIQRRTGHRSVQVLREYADEARAYEDEPLTEIAASARKKRK